jgi:hypothetical protein
VYCGKDDKGGKFEKQTRKKQGIKKYEKGGVVARMKFKRPEFNSAKYLATGL